MPLTPEVQRESDKTTDTSTLSKLGEECWDKVQRSASVAKVVGEGLAFGVVDGAKDAWADKKGTGVKLAWSVGVGAILGVAERGSALMKTGAALAGAGFAGAFAYDTMRHGSAICDTISNTWKNGATDSNVDAMKHNLGQYVFDTGLMMAGGLAGGKVSGDIKVALGAGDRNFPAFRGLDGKLPLQSRIEEFLPGDTTLGRELSADIKKGSGTKDVFSQAQDILAKRKSYQLGDTEAMAAWDRDRIIGSDEHAAQLRNQIADIAGKAQDNKVALDRANKELADLKNEQSKVGHLTAETTAVAAAERSLASLEAQKAELPGLKDQAASLRTQISDLTKAKEKAQGHEEGETKKAKQGETQHSSVEDLQAELGRIRDRMTDINKSLDENNPDSAINRTRKQLTQAQEALQAATQTKDARVAELQTQIDGKTTRVGELQAADKQFGTQLHDAIKALDARVAEVKADQSKSVARQTDLVEPKAPPKEPPVITQAARPVREVARTTARTGDAAANTAVRTDKVEKPAAPEKAADKIDKTPFELAAEKAEAALKTARSAVTEFKAQDDTYQKAQDDIKAARRQIADIQAGKTKFDDDAAKAAALSQANADLATAQGVRPPKYFKPMAMVNSYARSVEGMLASSRDYGTAAKDGVSNLQAMLDDLRNSRNGVGGRRSIPDAAQAAKSGISAEEMLHNIREHLDLRLKDMNDKHSSRISEATKSPIIQDAFAKADKGEFPANATILFYQNGEIVKYRDGSGRMANAYFDVQHPSGSRRPDRLIGSQPDGYVVVGPRLRPDGTPVTIKARGPEPTIVKEVLFTSGNVPEGTVAKGTDADGKATRGTGLGDLLNLDRKKVSGK